MSNRTIKFLQIAVVSSVAFLGALGVPAGADSNSKLSCPVLPHLMNEYFRYHIQSEDMTNELKERTATLMLKRLDPSKILYLEAEAKKMKDKIISSFDQIKKRDCSNLDTIYPDVIGRSQKIEKMVKAITGDKKYALDRTTELVIDPDDRGWPKDETAQTKTLTKLVHFQISNYLASGSKLKDAKTQLAHRYEILSQRSKELNQQDIYSDFLDSFSSALDPHSSYLSPEVLEDFRISMSLSLEGIGVSLSSKDGFTIVEEIITGGATDRVNALEPKDKIIAVAQDDGKPPVNIIDKSLRDVVRLIRGKKGTKVHLTLLRQDGDKTTRVTRSIIRDKIDLKQQAAKIRYEKRKIGKKDVNLAVLELPSFYGDDSSNARSAYRDMKKLLKEAKTKKVDGLLLDLSRNGGGLLMDAVRISGFFIKEGPIVATQDSQTRVQVLEDEDPETLYRGPMVVLTSRLSASASEILAGALKDYSRAIIIGDGHTFGKGSVQQVIPLKPGYGALKVTNGMFFRPGGKSTQHSGVESDVVIPTRYSSDEIGEKSLDYSLPMRKIPVFKKTTVNSPKPEEHWEPVTAAELEEIRLRSKTRVEKDKDLQEVVKKIAEAKKKKTGIVKLAEVEKEQKEASKDEKKDEGKSREEIVRELDAPQVNEALNILTDLISLDSNSVIAGTEQRESNGSRKDN